MYTTTGNTRVRLHTDSINLTVITEQQQQQLTPLPHFWHANTLSHTHIHTQFFRVFYNFFRLARAHYNRPSSSHYGMHPSLSKAMLSPSLSLTLFHSLSHTHTHTHQNTHKHTVLEEGEVSKARKRQVVVQSFLK